jgi:hypothetical protein
MGMGREGGGERGLGRAILSSTVSTHDFFTLVPCNYGWRYESMSMCRRGTGAFIGIVGDPGWRQGRGTTGDGGHTQAKIESSA